MLIIRCKSCKDCDRYDIEGVDQSKIQFMIINATSIFVMMRIQEVMDSHHPNMVRIDIEPGKTDSDWSEANDIFG